MFRSLPSYRAITVNSCHSPTGVGVLSTSGESCYHRCRVPTCWSIELNISRLDRIFALPMGTIQVILLELEPKGIFSDI